MTKTWARLAQSRRRGGLAILVAAPWFVVTGLCALADSSPLSVTEVVAGRLIKFVIPAGFCPIGDQTQQERQWRDLQERINVQRNRVIVIFAECTELRRFRDDPAYRVRNHGLYGISLSPRALYPENYPRSKFLAAASQRLEKIDVRQIEQKLNEKLNEAGDGSTVQDFAFGMVDANADAVFIATGTLLDDRGESVKQSGITAITLAKGVFVSIHLYSDYRAEPGLWSLLDAQRRLASSFTAANERQSDEIPRQTV